MIPQERALVLVHPLSANVYWFCRLYSQTHSLMAPSSLWLFFRYSLILDSIELWMHPRDLSCLHPFWLRRRRTGIPIICSMRHRCLFSSSPQLKSGHLCVLLDVVLLQDCICGHWGAWSHFVCLTLFWLSDISHLVEEVNDQKGEVLQLCDSWRAPKIVPYY